MVLDQIFVEFRLHMGRETSQHGDDDPFQHFADGSGNRHHQDSLKPDEESLVVLRAKPAEKRSHQVHQNPGDFIVTLGSGGIGVDRHSSHLFCRNRAEERRYEIKWNHFCKGLVDIIFTTGNRYCSFVAINGERCDCRNCRHNIRYVAFRAESVNILLWGI